jgi:hypothetical protein
MKNNKKLRLDYTTRLDICYAITEISIIVTRQQTHQADLNPFGMIIWHSTIEISS